MSTPASAWAHDSSVPVPVEKYRQLLRDEFTVEILAAYLGRPLDENDDPTKIVKHVQNVLKRRAA